MEREESGSYLECRQQSRGSEALWGGVDELDKGLAPSELLHNAAPLGFRSLTVPDHCASKLYLFLLPPQKR